MKTRLKIFTSTIALVWISLILLIFLSGVQESPINVSRVTKNFQLAVIPQGWAFFTKNCREPLMSIFSIDHANKVQEVSTIGNRSNPLTSFDRVDRKQMVEVSDILRRINNEQWKNCPETMANCLTPDAVKDSKIYSFENTVSNPTLCGETLITMSDTVPWAWANLTERNQMPGKSIRLFIICKKGVPHV